MTPHLKQLARESAVYGLASVISRFLSILIVPVYTRMFSPRDYGVMSLVTASMVIVGIFAYLGLDSAAGRWYWDTEDDEDRKTTIASWAWCQIGTSIFLCSVIFLGADEISRHVTGSVSAATYFRLAAATLPLTTLGVVLTNWLRMLRRPWATMAFTLGINVFGILLSILLVVFLRRGLVGIYWAQLLANALATVVAAKLLGAWIDPRRLDWPRLWTMLKFALPLIPAALAFWVVGFADRYFVRFYSSTSEVGLYQIGSSLAALIALVTTAFQQAWGPFSYSIHRRPEARQVYASVFIAYAWVTCIASTGLALFAPEIIRILATKTYVGASSVVGLLAFSYVMIGFGYVAVTGPSIVKTTTPTAVAVVIAACLNIPLNVLLVPHLGKVGAATATLLSQSIVPLYVFHRAQQMYPIPFRFGPVVGLLALSTAELSFSAVWHFPDIVVSVVIKLILLGLFVAALFLFKLVGVTEARSALRALANTRTLGVRA